MRNELYLQKRMSASDVAESIRSGDTVYLAGNSLTPRDVGNAMAELIGARENIRLLTFLPLFPTAVYTTPGGENTFQMESIFHNRVFQHAVDHDYCTFVPNNLRNVVRDWSHVIPQIDLMVVTVSPMDKHGYFTLAGSAGIELEMLPLVKRLVVEVASHAPRVFGDTLIHISQVWGIVESDRYPGILPKELPTPEDERMGEYIAELVEDGDTIQLGIGGTVEALAKQLRSKQGLGIHTEMLSDTTMDLIQCGAVTNTNKTLHPGFSVTAFCMGTTALYDFIDDNPAILTKSVSYTNDLNVLARNRNMISINATLYVDLSGQCASEGVGTQQISGTGGQVDTGVGAQMSGGKSVITVKSTRTRKDPQTGQPVRESCIQPLLPLGTTVTYTRSNVHYVATEYGVVCLRGLSVRERARQLISIAHPDFRDWLRDEFQRLYKMKL